MLELGMTVDEIIFCDTGVEFPQMYEHIANVEKYIGRPITRLKREHSFEYMMLEHMVNTKKEHKNGYSFPGPLSRWCTKYFKQSQISMYLRDRKSHHLMQYVGIAADEPKRIKDLNYPLVDWGWTEADCLNYCKEKGFDWGGLYDIFKRVSCWCCPLQSLDGCRKLRHHFPDLWQTLLDWQHKTWRKFRADYSVDDLEQKFQKEEQFQQMQMDLWEVTI
jgi:3'-phosphoadenosine 5'-phosphosulfate sulfotransferase (PAPS reductase)/FAD synthetase